jgi:septum formation protein
MMTSSFQIILASASPRRRELLMTSGITPLIQPSHIEEIRSENETPIIYCQRLAREKAQSVASASTNGKDIIIAADTVVYMDRNIYEKPRDDQDAFMMLKALSQGWHHVVSAWHICSVDARFVRFGHRISDVCFRDLQDDEIWSYIRTGEGYDKAGSYGIQGLGAALVEEIRGSYSNIVGLPLADVLKGIREYCP